MRAAGLVQDAGQAGLQVKGDGEGWYIADRAPNHPWKTKHCSFPKETVGAARDRVPRATSRLIALHRGEKHTQQLEDFPTSGPVLLLTPPHAASMLV